jgi:hypothetical protein
MFAPSRQAAVVVWTPAHEHVFILGRDSRPPGLSGDKVRQSAPAETCAPYGLHERHPAS